jgi:acetylornithine deacetylase
MFLNLEKLKKDSIKLLIKLINTPSISRKEKKTADIIQIFLKKYGFFTNRKFNNIWVENNNCKKKNPKKILLNSHHDTVYPSKNWKYNPFKSVIKGEKIIGLGSNDAGGCVVSLIIVFIYLSSLYELPYKLILVLSAEEEINAKKGIKSILPQLGKIDLGIIGEPTKMNMAIAEKGLIVLYCQSNGKTGHAAREEGINSIYLALDDIQWIRKYNFKKNSNLLGKIKTNVTQIKAGIQRNVIPDICNFTVDIRFNEFYSYKEIFNLFKKNIKSKILTNSYFLNPSFIKNSHPIIKKAKKIGIKTYGSPTLSDQSLMKFDTIKIGVGDSARSHTQNEYIMIYEIKKGIDIYINLLKDFSF